MPSNKTTEFKSFDFEMNAVPATCGSYTLYNLRFNNGPAPKGDRGNKQSVPGNSIKELSAGLLTAMGYANFVQAITSDQQTDAAVNELLEETGFKIVHSFIGSYGNSLRLWARSRPLVETPKRERTTTKKDGINEVG